jgi:twinkle protein
MRYSEIAKKLAIQTESIVQMLLPNGTTKNGNYYAASVKGGKGNSLKVTLTGQYRGNWRDFNPNIGGDLIDLWSQSRDIELCDAYDQACEFLNVEKQYFKTEQKIYNKPCCTIHQLSDKGAKYLKDYRKIPEDIATRYKVGVSNGCLEFNFYRDGLLVNRKTLPINRDENGKKLPARFEKDCELCLFGWDAFTRSGRSVTICEGEIDAMSLAAYGYQALSVPTGASGTSWIENDFDRLERFDKIYLCFDNDDAG